MYLVKGQRHFQSSGCQFLGVETGRQPQAAFHEHPHKLQGGEIIFKNNCAKKNLPSPPVSGYSSHEQQVFGFSLLEFIRKQWIVFSVNIRVPSSVTAQQHSSWAETHLLKLCFIYF